MIDWAKVEWADNMLITFKDGEKWKCKGNGIVLKSEYDDEDMKFDTLHVIKDNRNIALNMEDIKSIEF
ncbi:MAG: hypothetical protein Q4E02_00830 [Lagierella massiliensis]|nr:hypothetical protein [Lagierella massiliensis]